MTEKRGIVEKELSNLQKWGNAGYVISYGFLVVAVFLGLTSLLEYAYREPLWDIISQSLYVAALALVVVLVLHLHFEARRKVTTIAALQQRIQSLERTIQEKRDTALQQRIQPLERTIQEKRDSV